MLGVFLESKSRGFFMRQGRPREGVAGDLGMGVDCMSWKTYSVGVLVSILDKADSMTIVLFCSSAVVRKTIVSATDTIGIGAIKGICRPISALRGSGTCRGSITKTSRGEEYTAIGFKTGPVADRVCGIWN